MIAARDRSRVLAGAGAGSLYHAGVRPVPLALLGCLVLAGGSATARAQEGEERRACVASYEQAQRLRLAGDLKGARAELRACSLEACPELVQHDCVGWLREVEAEIPSVIVSVRSPAGLDRTDVWVFVDGKLEQERLSGAALELRPGERKFRFEAPGAPAVEQSVVINTGEKNRLLSVIMGSEPRRDTAPVASSKAAGRPVAPLAIGAAGLVAAGVGIGLDLSGSAELREMRATCAPRCAEADVDATRGKIIAGDALIGVGVLAVGAAVILWLASDEPAPPASAQAPRRASFVVTF